MNEASPIMEAQSRALVPVDTEPATGDVLDQRIRARTRTAKMAAAALAFLVLVGGALVPIGGAVIAPAEVAPETRIKRVAHPTGGVISEIYVADGDMVSEGDLMLRLATDVSEVRAEFSERTLAQLLAQRARLTAEVENRNSVRFPPELLRTRAKRHKQQWRLNGAASRSTALRKAA
ncbi:MAG: biotin/lipoyl-binding protein [Pseudomonadota bacterium]